MLDEFEELKMFKLRNWKYWSLAKIFLKIDIYFVFSWTMRLPAKFLATFEVWFLLTFCIAVILDKVSIHEVTLGNLFHLSQSFYLHFKCTSVLSHCHAQSLAPDINMRTTASICRKKASMGIPNDHLKM